MTRLYPPPTLSELTAELRRRIAANLIPIQKVD